MKNGFRIGPEARERYFRVNFAHPETEPSPRRNKIKLTSARAWRTGRADAMVIRGLAVFRVSHTPENPQTGKA